METSLNDTDTQLASFEWASGCSKAHSFISSKYRLLWAFCHFCLSCQYHLTWSRLLVFHNTNREPLVWPKQLLIWPVQQVNQHQPHHHLPDQGCRPVRGLPPSQWLIVNSHFRLYPSWAQDYLTPIGLFYYSMQLVWNLQYSAHFVNFCWELATELAKPAFNLCN